MPPNVSATHLKLKKGDVVSRVFENGAYAIYSKEEQEFYILTTMH